MSRVAAARSARFENPAVASLHKFFAGTESGSDGSALIPTRRSLDGEAARERDREIERNSQAEGPAGKASTRRGQSRCIRALEGRTRAHSGARGEVTARTRRLSDRNRRGSMKSPVVKRSIVIAGHKTSVSLEDASWRGLKESAAARTVTPSDLVATIDGGRRSGNLSSAIRLFVLDFYRSQSGADRTESPPNE